MTLHYFGRVYIYGYADSQIIRPGRVMGGQRPPASSGPPPPGGPVGYVLSEEGFSVTHVQVFDPPMCCSSGVCGPAVGPALPRFAADLDWLESQGVQIDRYALSLQPEMFAAADAVQQALSSDGVQCLPLVLVDGQIVSRGTYPSRDDLAALSGLTGPGTEPSSRMPPKNLGRAAAGQGGCNTVAGGCCGSTGSLRVIPPNGCC
jgi:hypothetical protein